MTALPIVAQPHRPGATSAGHRACVMVAFNPDSCDLPVRQLRAGGIAIELALGWGDIAGFAALRRDRPPLIVLDATVPRTRVDPLWHVRALCRLGPVIVFTDDTMDAYRLLDAGAYDVLDRALPTPEAVARIKAHLRRLVAVARPDSVSTVVRSSSPQRFLVDWLQALPLGCCCHELRYLLGMPGKPLTLPALRARICRVGPLLHGRGLAVTERRSWGQAWYRVGPLNATGHGWLST